MSTKMTERDWELEAVRACLPRRGAEGRDDRLFLEALHCFAVHDVTWRALPRAVRPLEQRVEAVFAAEPGGVFEAFFAMLAECNRTAGVVQMFDSTWCAPTCPPQAPKGGRGARVGRSRGGYSTKIHLNTDFDGHPIAFEITGGENADAPLFETPLHLGPDAAPRAVVADKGHDSRANRAAARACGALPVIPQKANAAMPAKHFARALHRGRARIEQAVGRLKRFRRIALRCEKTKADFASFTALAIGFILVQFVHTA